MDLKVGFQIALHRVVVDKQTANKKLNDVGISHFVFRIGTTATNISQSTLDNSNKQFALSIWHFDNGNEHWSWAFKIVLIVGIGI